MERIETYKDSFIDFRGQEHKFMLAAVSMSMEHEESIISEYVEDPKDWSEYHFEDHVAEKVLSMGIAVCHPSDEWNEKKAYLTATGRARKYRNRALYATKAGSINTTMVQAWLRQEAEFLKNNPEELIPGYDDLLKREAKRQAKLAKN